MKGCRRVSTFNTGGAGCMPAGKKSQENRERQGVYDRPVILEKDVFTGEYAPVSTLRRLTLFHQGSAILTEECRRGVSGSSHQRVLA